MSESFFAPIQDTETTIEAEQSEIIAPRPAWAKYLKDRDAVPARSNVLMAASPASRAQRSSPAKHLEMKSEFVPLLPKSLSTTNLDSPSATARKAVLLRSPTKLDVVSRLREEAGVARSPLRAYAPAQGTPTDRRRTVLAGSPAVRRLSGSPDTPLAGKTPVARVLHAETAAAVTPPTMTRARLVDLRADLRFALILLRWVRPLHHLVNQSQHAFWQKDPAQLAPDPLVRSCRQSARQRILHALDH